jgi:hypothetical protein
MASVCNEPNGRRRIELGPVADRKRIRLGKATAKHAEAFKVKVEQLVSAKILGHSADDETTRWVAELDDVMHGKVAAVGLVKRREATALGAWLDKYMEGRRIDPKCGSWRKLDLTRQKLLAFFDPKSPLRSVTPDGASDWRLKLMAGGLSEASVKHHVGNAKGLFNDARRRGLIPSNPFDHLSGGATAARNDRYVTPDEADRIIEACPDLRWKVLFGLGR